MCVLLLSTVSVATAAWNTDFRDNYNRSGIDKAVTDALENGVTPWVIVEKGLKLDGLNPRRLITALFCAGANGKDIRSAAEHWKITSEVVAAGYIKANVECDGAVVDRRTYAQNGHRATGSSKVAAGDTSGFNLVTFKNKYEGSGIDKAVSYALKTGATPLVIVEHGLQFEGLNPQTLIRALYCAGADGDAIRTAAKRWQTEIAYKIVLAGHEKANSKCGEALAKGQVCDQTDTGKTTAAPVVASAAKPEAHSSSTFQSNYTRHGIRTAVSGALQSGATPFSIVESGLRLDGLQPQKLVTALYCAGADGEKIRTAADHWKLSKEVVAAGYKKAVVECSRVVADEKASRPKPSKEVASMRHQGTKVDDVQANILQSSYTRSGIDKAVKQALKGGVSPLLIVGDGIKLEGLAPQNLIKALYCAGAEGKTIRSAAKHWKLNREVVAAGYKKATVACNNVAVDNDVYVKQPLKYATNSSSVPKHNDLRDAALFKESYNRSGIDKAVTQALKEGSTPFLIVGNGLQLDGLAPQYLFKALYCAGADGNAIRAAAKQWDVTAKVVSTGYTMANIECDNVVIDNLAYDQERVEDTDVSKDVDELKGDQGSAVSSFQDKYLNEGIDKAVIYALEDGQPPFSIVEKGVQLDGLNPQNLVKALYCAGANGEDIRSAAGYWEISDEIVAFGYKKATVECEGVVVDSQAYTQSSSMSAASSVLSAGNTAGLSPYTF